MYKPKPHDLFDFLMRESDLESDAALARALGVPAPTVSKIRNGKGNVSAEIILKIHRLTGLSVETIDRLLESTQGGKK
jgi:plasmid maintenance system antidote protein VapI